jgi:hypothetical protein
MRLTTPQGSTARAIRRSRFPLRFRPGRPRLLNVPLVAPPTPDALGSFPRVRGLIRRQTALPSLGLRTAS